MVRLAIVPPGDGELAARGSGAAIDRIAADVGAGGAWVDACDDGAAGDPNADEPAFDAPAGDSGDGAGAAADDETHPASPAPEPA